MEQEETRQVIQDHGRWLLARGSAAYVITSDEEMINVGRDPAIRTPAFGNSFVEVCERAVREGNPRVGVSYDYFFGGVERRIYPTDPECIATYRRLHDVAKSYGLDFEASILSPLDLGVPWIRSGRRPGLWYQFQEAPLMPGGEYRVALPLQLTWFHNKGPCHLTVEGVRAFAFTETRLGDSAHYHVDPDAIVDVSDTARYTVTQPGQFETTGDLTPDRGYHVGEIVVHGAWGGAVRGNTRTWRVLAVVVYRAEEMDYFAPDAPDFLRGVIAAHAGAGIRYGGFYADEMHIQWDWHLNAHIGHEEIKARYLTDGLAEKYASLYGNEYRDFARYLVYFAYHQHDFLVGPEGALPSQHILSPDAQGVARTIWLRRNYYHLLNDHVVDLFVQARDHAAGLFGRPMFTQAHATWQESPTCDWFAPGYAFGKQLPDGASRYDYTPDYVWSASQHEAVATGYDYFRWGDFLTGMGTDHPEGGNTDRNHYAKALAASFAALDDYGLSYCGFWGSPQPVMRRMRNAVAAFGDLHSPAAWVQEWQARATPVLMLYPLDLFYVEERFGSWMVQYGYGDYITQQKLLEHAVVEDGALVVRGPGGLRRYTHLVALFEPLVRPATNALLRAFVESGGTLIWAGPPATIDELTGSLLEPAAHAWHGSEGSMFEGRPVPSGTVRFGGPLAPVEPMLVGTALRPDWVYPIHPRGGEPCAWLEVEGSQPLVVGVLQDCAAGHGRVLTLGFRPRDDQSASTGQDWRTLFQILRALGAYGTPDQPEVLSRTGEYLVCRSPNGAISVARHYAALVERWSGEFFRDDKADAALPLDLPPMGIELDDATIAGRRVSFRGRDLLCYRITGAGRPFAFYASGSTGISIDGHTTTWSDRPIELLCAPISPDRLAAGIRQAWVVMADADSEDGPGHRDLLYVTLPLNTAAWHDIRLGSLDLFTGNASEIQHLPPSEQDRLAIRPEWAGKLLVLFETDPPWSD